MKRKRIIYFHGFGSSSQSGTIQTLRELLPDYKVIAPDIPVDPTDALPYLLELCKYVKPDVVIGTSMGGMYAQQMCGFKRICVNPAFEMSVKSKMLKVGTFEYFKPRKDGATHFTITPKIIENFARMEERQFAGARDDQDGQVWGLFGSNDKQVNCEEIFRRYYSNVIRFDGEHRMNDVVIRDVLVPLIQKLANSDDIITDSSLVPFEDENGKWGFKNVRTNMISIAPKYDEVESFSEGLARVTEEADDYFINYNGEVIISGHNISTSYGVSSVHNISAQGFTNGLSPILVCGDWHWVPNVLCYYDKAGREIPLKYCPDSHLDASPFSNGRAAIKDYKTNLWGYIDTNGDLVIPFEYEEARDFDGGIAAVMKNGKYGCIDRQGKVLVPFSYDSWTDLFVFKHKSGSIFYFDPEDYWKDDEDFSCYKEEQ